MPKYIARIAKIIARICVFVIPVFGNRRPFRCSHTLSLSSVYSQWHRGAKRHSACWPFCIFAVKWALLLSLASLTHGITQLSENMFWRFLRSDASWITLWNYEYVRVHLYLATSALFNLTYVLYLSEHHDKSSSLHNFNFLSEERKEKQPKR